MVIGALPAVALFAWPAASGSDAYLRVTAPSDVAGIDQRLMDRVEVALMDAGIDPRGVVLDRSGVSVRLADAGTRDHALSPLKRALGAIGTVSPDTTPRLP